MAGEWVYMPTTIVEWRQCMSAENICNRRRPFETNAVEGYAGAGVVDQGRGRCSGRTGMK
jgi:hypothetical protein